MRKFRPFEQSTVLEFRDPDTGHIHRPTNSTLPVKEQYKSLYTNIIAYRDQNGLEPIEMLRETVENYLCGLPDNCNKCTNTDLPRGVYTYVKGGLNLFKMMLFKRFASQDVAEKRAAQCETCKFNVFPDKGAFMNWADNIAIAQVEERKVPNGAKLGSCEVCTCVLRSKVFSLEKEKFTPEQIEKFKSVNCWQING